MVSTAFDSVSCQISLNEIGIGLQSTININNNWVRVRSFQSFNAADHEIYFKLIQSWTTYTS